MTTAPKGAKQPQDHKKPAAQVEAEGDEFVEFEFRGKEYRLPADPQDWPVAALRTPSSVNACAIVMERHGYPVDSWSGRRLNELFELYAEVAGFDNPGE